jgi:biofilm PGA synthesis N-glycosyltransferase PgaC
MWIIVAEYLMSITWAYVVFAVMALGIVGLLFPLPGNWSIPGPLPGWYGVIMGIICVCQFAVSLVIDRRYEKGIGRQSFWVIWYPYLYWLLGMMTAIVSVPKVIFTPVRKRAVWTASDRGIQ